MEFARIRLELEGGVATLTLDHPEVLNATSNEMIAGLGQALDVVEAKGSGARCLLLTGAGRGFCAGANLQGRREGAAEKPPTPGVTLETLYHPLLRRLRDLPCPIVAAVNGVAAGVGMSLALMGDLILAARSAYFLQAFRRIGLVPDGGSTWMLPRRIGMARALQLSLLGERLPAETALAWGLINRVCDDATLMDEARALARDLAAGPTVALGLTRRLYWASGENSFEGQLGLECRSQIEAGQTADFKEGVAAFLEKRKAEFRGE
jgi:2-(1,2-epoxy-1,2-dihydrophenyl)acetyl-CoA isomerase